MPVFYDEFISPYFASEIKSNSTHLLAIKKWNQKHYTRAVDTGSARLTFYCGKRGDEASSITLKTLDEALTRFWIPEDHIELLDKIDKELLKKDFIAFKVIS